MLRIILSLALGAFAGWMAGNIMKEKHSLLVNILLGIGGGIIGSWIGSLLGVVAGWILSLILTIVGACILIWLYGVITGKK